MPGTRIVSRRFTGYFTAPAAGNYIVALEGAGEGTGNRVYLDGKQIIDNWEIVRAFQPHVTLELSAGPHKVVAEDWQTFVIGGRLRLGIVDEKEDRERTGEGTCRQGRCGCVGGWIFGRERE